MFGLLSADSVGVSRTAGRRLQLVGHGASFCLGRWLAPTFKSGTFDVFVSVGEADGTPVYELPLSDSDGRRRYRLGKLTMRQVQGKGR